MTTRFTQDELMQMRAVKKSAAVLFIAALFDRKYPGRSYRVADIAADLDLDRRTVDAACKSLSAGGKMIFDGNGYVLTAGGRAMLLGGTYPTLDEPKALAPLTTAQAPQTTEVIEVAAEDIHDDEQGTENVQPADDAQNVQSPRLTVRALFEAADGMEGFLEGADQYLGRMAKSGVNPDLVSPRLAISWMAHAYDQRSRDGRRYGIQTPGWFVVSKLTDPSQPKPGRQYWDHPRDYLPDGFLAAVGLPRAYDCQVCGAKFSAREALEAHLAEEHPVKAEALTALEEWTERVVIGTAATVQVSKIEIDNGAADVWRTVMSTLEAEMPPASFQTWVADTEAGEMQGNGFTVLTRNAFARDWLEMRLGDTITRILCGLLGRDVSVRFVVRRHEEG